MKYGYFIRELRRLREEGEVFCKKPDIRHDDAAFHEWKKKIENLEKSIKDEGYRLSAPIWAMQRDYGRDTEYRLDATEKKIHDAFLKGVHKTMIEIDVVLGEYKQYGSPERIKKPKQKRRLSFHPNKRAMSVSLFVFAIGFATGVVTERFVTVERIRKLIPSMDLRAHVQEYMHGEEDPDRSFIYPYSKR